MYSRCTPFLASNSCLKSTWISQMCRRSPSVCGQSRRGTKWTRPRRMVQPTSTQTERSRYPALSSTSKFGSYLFLTLVTFIHAHPLSTSESDRWLPASRSGESRPWNSATGLADGPGEAAVRLMVSDTSLSCSNRSSHAPISSTLSTTTVHRTTSLSSDASRWYDRTVFWIARLGALTDPNRTSPTVFHRDTHSWNCELSSSASA
mmetsp:Transcript_63445/g.169704  ORF Transcript_63445/g.169704 Transcript_63445/m.169704 type:complete len:205 (+) Transcript_63445:67-681(+)